MQAPRIPENEHERLAALYELGILDTPAEERFDRLTRLATRLFDVPMALISIIDKDRQWFKSCTGLCDVSETPRSISFCGHAILSADAMVVPDALKDKRFADNPLVTGEPYIRFYAGQPLTARNGTRLGVLCLNDRRPRDFTEQDRQLLRDLAAMVEDQLYLVQLSELQRAVQERQRAEEALHKSEEQVRTLMQTVNQLRVEIDEGRKDRQVAEITESDYFQHLQRKAHDLRIRRRKAQ